MAAPAIQLSRLVEILNTEFGEGTLCNVTVTAEYAFDKFESVEEVRLQIGNRYTHFTADGRVLGSGSDIDPPVHISKLDIRPDGKVYLKKPDA